MGHVFISYSNADAPAALSTCAALEGASIACWIAPRDIAAGQDWAAEIIDGSNGADLFLLVFSEHTNGSPQVRREVERAVHKEVAVMPVRVQNVLPSKSLEYFVSAQHWFDAYQGEFSAHLPALVQRVRLAQERHSARVSSSSVSKPESGRTIESALGAQARALDPSALGVIERNLALSIGPIASVLVRNAASRATSLETLIALLAAEIDSPQDRSRFVEACRRRA